MKSSHNLLHDWKEARLERSYLSQVGFLGSSIRTSFLRAWLVTAVKVLFVFTFLNFHVDVAAKLEENVALLDRYVHNDFSIPEQSILVAPGKTKSKKAPVVVTLNLQPRGPSESPSTAEVAGDSTAIPSSSLTSNKASQ